MIVAFVVVGGGGGAWAVVVLSKENKLVGEEQWSRVIRVVFPGMEAIEFRQLTGQYSQSGDSSISCSIAQGRSGFF